VAEVLNHAIKVDFWDVNALADAIYGLLTYPALTAMTVRCGLEEVNSLKWDNAALKVKHIYESVTEEKSKIQ
jgi:glycosyltransferase involved in cell wall biosynthesis